MPANVVHLNFTDDKTIVVRPATQAGTQQKWFIDGERIRQKSQGDETIGFTGDVVRDGLQCCAVGQSENNCWMIDRQ
jgi:hypothetical protein